MVVLLHLRRQLKIQLNFKLYLLIRTRQSPKNLWKSKHLSKISLRSLKLLEYSKLKLKSKRRNLTKILLSLREKKLKQRKLSKLRYLPSKLLLKLLNKSVNKLLQKSRTQLHHHKQYKMYVAWLGSCGLALMLMDRGQQSNSTFLVT